MADSKDINASHDDNSPSPPTSKTVKTNKKGKGKLMFFLILFLIIGGIAAVLILDIGGFRENVIMPYLRNAPIVGGFIPAPVYEEEEELTPEELLQRYTILSQQLESVQTQLALANQQNVTYEELIVHLRAFENAWHLYRAARAQFEQMIALGDPENFIQFFDFVSEDNLVQRYLEAMAMAEFIEETTAIVATLNNMDESGAGEVLENLMTTDLDLMIRALWMMTPTRRAEIFDTLEADVVTRMIVLMSPDEPIIAPALPPALPEFPPPPPAFPEGYDVFSEDFWRDLFIESLPDGVLDELPDGYIDEWAQEMVELAGTPEFWSLFAEGFIAGIIEGIELPEAEDATEEEVEDDDEEDDE